MVLQLLLLTVPSSIQSLYEEFSSSFLFPSCGKSQYAFYDLFMISVEGMGMLDAAADLECSPTVCHRGDLPILDAPLSLEFGGACFSCTLSEKNVNLSLVLWSFDCSTCGLVLA